MAYDDQGNLIGGNDKKKTSGGKVIKINPNVRESEKARGQKPIGGLPRDYKTRIDTPYGPAVVRPRYWTGGAEILPGGWSLKKRYQIATELAAIGWLNPKEATGEWNGALKTAWFNLLTEANRSGKPWRQVLDEKKNELLGPEGAGFNFLAGGADRRVQPKVIRLSNPDDIAAILEEAAQKLWSGGLSPEQIGGMIETFQAMERESQEAAYTAAYGASGTGLDAMGGTVVEPMSASTLAEQTLQRENPEQIFVSALGRNLAGIIPGLMKPGGGLI